MKHRRAFATLFCLFLILNFSNAFAQHWLQVDDGLTHYSLLEPQSGANGNIFLLPALPPGQTQIFLTQQQGSPTVSNAWLHGGNNNGSPAIPNYGTIGTLDNVNMTFVTGGLGNVRMTILGTGPNAGNIGIGTPSPSFILDIAGTGGPRFRVKSNDGFYAGMLAENNTHQYFCGIQGTFESAGGVTSGFHIYDNTANARRMVIDATGNMGIGSSNPLSLLSVGASNQFQVSSTGDIIKLKNVTYSWPAANAAFALANDGAGNLSWTAAALFHIVETYSTSAPYDAANHAGERLQSTGAATAIDLVLSPKANGALQAQLADGTPAGGNLRGSNAVDWQMTRGGAGTQTQVASGANATIGGGQFNTSSNAASTVAGGSTNTASGQYSFVGGGQGNGASNINSVVGGGSNNSASNANATVAGGLFNVASGKGSFVGGGGTDGTTNNPNVASGNASVVSGGMGNSAPSDFSVIGGGQSNTVGPVATVGGGINNKATSTYSTIGGGQNNTSSAGGSVVGGGQNNTASGTQSTVTGGQSNQATGPGSFIGGGGFDGITTSGNTASGNGSVVGGGLTNKAIGAYSSIMGGQQHQAIGISSTIGGGFNNNAGGANSAITGGVNNLASGPGAFIGGGGNDGATISGNTASGKTSVVAGGLGNTASADYSFIGSGQGNNATTGTHITIGGGFVSTATGICATIAGGENNQATGTRATIGGGTLNNNSGGYSTISGGLGNNISGVNSAIPGGRGLTLSGNFSFGFLGNNGPNTMSIAASSVAVFGNTDLWLTNNLSQASALRFYAPNATASGAFPPAGIFYSGFKTSATAQSDNYLYTWPSTAPAASQSLMVTAIAGSNPIAATLAWVNTPSGSGTLNYIPKWTSATALGNSLLQDNGTTVGIGGVPNAGASILTAYASGAAIPTYGDVLITHSNAGNAGGTTVGATLSLSNPLTPPTLNQAAAIAFDVDGTSNFTASGDIQSNAEIRAINMSANGVGGGNNATDLAFRVWNGSTGFPEGLRISGVNNGTASLRQTNPYLDNTYDLGTTALRWRNIFLSGGISNTANNPLDNQAEGVAPGGLNWQVNTVGYVATFSNTDNTTVARDGIQIALANNDGASRAINVTTGINFNPAGGAGNRNEVFRVMNNGTTIIGSQPADPANATAGTRLRLLATSGNSDTWDYGLVDNGNQGYIESNYDNFGIWLDADNNVPTTSETFTINRGANHTGGNTVFKVDGTGAATVAGSLSIGGGTAILSEFTATFNFTAVSGPYNIANSGARKFIMTGGALAGLNLTDAVIAEFDDAVYANNFCVISASVVAANQVVVNVANNSGGAVNDAGPFNIRLTVIHQ